MGRNRASPAAHSAAGDVVQRSIAEDVRDFYERYPYPQPVETLDAYRQLWTDHSRRRADFHLFWPSRSYREDFSILVAGCGTSQAARHAVRWPNASVTGIDISTTSVRCTETLKHKYDLHNLEVHQLPIERVHELGRSFDQIVCTGVLHHLEDPDAGLAALRSVLKPHGVMHLMVYAPYGRTGIYMLQDFCRRLGIRATDAGIRELVAALCKLPQGHPLERLLHDAPDFRHEAALADALLHPQDRAYSVPQLFDFLARGGLRFDRWVKQAPYTPHCGVVAQLPHASRFGALSLVDQYSAVELFRGTMIRHSVVAHRCDSASDDVGFTGDDWVDYVPIRMPDTICVRDHLPPGAAAVLINPTHTDTDLVLPIDTLQLHLFEAIDGTRSIGDILDDTVPKVTDETQHIETGRRFFERLWHHDQIVVDATSARVGEDWYVTQPHADSQPHGSASGVSHALETDGRRLQP